MTEHSKDQDLDVKAAEATAVALSSLERARAAHRQAADDLAAAEAEAAAITAPPRPTKAKKGFTHVELLDASRRPAGFLEIPENDRQFRVFHGGRYYEHVDEAPDGLWQYALMS